MLGLQLIHVTKKAPCIREKQKGCRFAYYIFNFLKEISIEVCF